MNVKSVLVELDNTVILADQYQKPKSLLSDVVIVRLFGNNLSESLIRNSLEQAGMELDKKTHKLVISRIIDVPVEDYIR